MKNNYIEFPCGCKFEKNSKGLPIFNPNIEALPLHCERTWDMICEGNTKGVFQLESQLGQSKAKEVKPRSIEELSDLIAIIRPGCGDAIVDGKSLTQHYIDRKAGRDDVKYFDPRLKPILEPTYGILVYQEQAMQIAQLVANFSLGQADNLRKAIGKKNVDLMAKVKKEFLEGAIAQGNFTEKDAEEIFSWIEKSQKYSFNKSHSVSYALNGYQTAYAKAHFPRAFFTSYLRHADGKPKPFEEINELVNNARLMDIDVQPPSIVNMNSNFCLVNKLPTFGLVNVKSVGMSVFKQIDAVVKQNSYNVSDMGWDKFLMKVGRYIKSNSFESMIRAGVFDCYKKQRNKMLYDFNIYKELKDFDKDYLTKTKCKTFVEALEDLIPYIKKTKRATVHTERHIEQVRGSISALKSPPYELIDRPAWRAKQERDLLGVEITCSEVDEYDTTDGNCSCREYVKGFESNYIAIAAQISDIREWKIRGGKHKGEKMAFLKISDSSCSLDNVTVFSEDWQKLKSKIVIGKILLLRGNRDKNRGSFLVKQAQNLEQCI
jgi:DNA polymerase III alpha subunit|tara:strand:+ start:1686 stop:3323 length:1638 start_codon:yes stop_codon:yes gene_type:complete